nr:hypothetical transcript [Hymenolepis microstoma]
MISITTNEHTFKKEFLIRIGINCVFRCCGRFGLRLRGDVNKLLANWKMVIDINFPPKGDSDQWLQVFSDGSYVENQANSAGVYSELFSFFASKVM